MSQLIPREVVETAKMLLARLRGGDMVCIDDRCVWARGDITAAEVERDVAITGRVYYHVKLLLAGGGSITADIGENGELIAINLNEAEFRCD